MENTAHTIASLQALKELGVNISIDDFGTGYSNLGYLSQFSLSSLKIDRSFVRDILTDTNDKAIIKTILALGQSLELAVIAEGVETEAQYSKLLHLGCQQFQGYFFGEPMPQTSFVTRYRQRHEMQN